MDKYSRFSKSQLIAELHRLEETNSVLEQAQNLFFTGPVVMFKWRNSDDLPVDYVSPNVTEIFGYTVDDFCTGKVLYADIIAMPDFEQVLVEVKKAEDENIWAYDHSPYRIISKNGSEHLIQDHTVVVRNHKDEITHYYGYVFEISQPKSSDYQLDSNELRAQSILDSTSAMVSVKDLDGHYLHINRSFEILFDLPCDEIISKTDYDFYPKKMADTLRADDISVVEKNHLIEVEESKSPKDRLQRYISLKFPVHNNKGEVYAICGISTDIIDPEKAELPLINAYNAYSAYSTYSTLKLEFDERGNDLTELSRQINERLMKHSEVRNALHKSEKRFRNLLEQLPVIAVQGYDEERQVIFWNEASEHLYGYTEKEAMGNKLEDLIIPDSIKGRMVESVSNSLKTGLPMPAEEITLAHKDGIRIPVFSSHLMQINANEKPEMYKVDMDLSRLYEVRKKLEKANVEWDQIFDSVSDPIFVLDSNNRMVRANKAFIDHLKRDANSIIGETCYSCLQGENLPDDRCPYPEKLEGSVKCVIESFNENLDDDFLIKVTPLYDLDDMPVGSIHIAYDISERNRAEEKRLDKLEKQKNALVQEVHHRIKNHLHGLMGLLKQRTTSNHEHTDNLNDAISQIESIATVYGLQAGNPGSQLDFNKMLAAIVRNMAELSLVTLSLTNDIKRKKFLIDSKKAVSLALVINELLMNAVKHFYSRNDDSEIRIHQSLDDNGIRLTVCNPGELPGEFDFDSEQGFGVGLDLLKIMLPGQGANLSIRGHGGVVTAELILSPPLLSPVE